VNKIGPLMNENPYTTVNDDALCPISVELQISKAHTLIVFDR